MNQRNFSTNVTAEQATSDMFLNAEAISMTRTEWRVTYWERETLPSFSNWIIKVTFPNGLTVSVIGVDGDLEAAIQKNGRIQGDSVERFDKWSQVAEYINVVSELEPTND